PTLRAFESLDPPRREALRNDLLALARRYDRNGGTGPIAITADYLETVIDRRGGGRATVQLVSSAKLFDLPQHGRQVIPRLFGPKADGPKPPPLQKVHVFGVGVNLLVVNRTVHLDNQRG